MLRVGLSLPLPQTLQKRHVAVLVVCVCTAALLIRLGVGLHSYSGAGRRESNYGDYEAQRHWMEITINLPLREWYVNSVRNPLKYWGLDYPPLTAYHSWILGQIAHQYDESWVKLGYSRGTEGYEHKLFMRYSVILVDLLVFFPAIFFFVYVVYQTLNTVERLSVVFMLLISPTMILIDHGHFQYNCASLGLFLWAVVFAIRRDNIKCCIFFTLALNYKQMELYHSIPFFCFLLGRALQSDKTRLQQILSYGVAVLVTFTICWLPFLLEGQGQIVLVLERLFPVARGLYEDKVANFWCTVAPLIKFRYLPQGIQLGFSMMLTLFAQGPSVGHLVFYPSPYRFLLTLVNSSLAFFLFSYHVHEKSILLAALPVSLLSVIHPFLCTWFAIVATLSMYPLLVKDGLAIPCWILIAFFCLSTQLLLPYLRYKTSQMPRVTRRGFYCSLVVYIALCGLSHVVSPPARYPDLFPVLISSVSFLHFAGFLIYFTRRQLTSQVTSSKYQNVSKMVSVKKE